MSSYSCAVVGGGIIGVAVAREIINRLPSTEVTILEKEAGLAVHQTGHNSGVVHAGLYYEPGSLKARLCRRGGELLHEFCDDKGVAYEECGKVVIAQDDTEVRRLDNIFARAVENGAPNVRLIDAKELENIEPAAKGKAALYSPHTAIVDYVRVAQELANDVVSAGGQVLFNQEVTGIEQTRTGVKVFATELVGEFDCVITCAGLQSDRVSQQTSDDKNPRIIPFFGDYFLLSPQKRHLVNGLIYPVPDPKYPFLGVHLTKRIDGEIMLGPNAFLSPGREAYTRADVSLKDLAETAMFSGFWKFAARNIPAAVREARTVLNKSHFVHEAAKYVPGIELADVTSGGRGIRAQAMDSNGTLVDDFVISEMGRVTHLRNAPSPGATSSLAIAEHVVNRALISAGLSGT